MCPSSTFTGTREVGSSETALKMYSEWREDSMSFACYHGLIRLTRLYFGTTNARRKNPFTSKFSVLPRSQQLWARRLQQEEEIIP